MPFNKGDIVFLAFEMPHSGNYDPHPGVVLSCIDVYNKDRCYICAMMTSRPINDKFSFHLDDDMLDEPNDRDISQVRCHLITYVRERCLLERTPRNKLKPQALERLMAYINEVVFEY